MHSGKPASKPLSCDVNSTLDYFTLYPAKCTNMPVDIRFVPRHAGFCFSFGSLGWAGWPIIRVWTTYGGTCLHLQGTLRRFEQNPLPGTETRRVRVGETCSLSCCCFHDEGCLQSWVLAGIIVRCGENTVLL